MKDLLTEFNAQAINVFESYLKRLETETKEINGQKRLVNWWFKDIQKKDFADIFKKVHQKTGLFIDGESITLAYRKKLIVNYDYHAYKNVVQNKYPESKFDFGVVFKGDEFSFKKETGKVFYTHTINNPFNLKKEVIGGYGIIKNSQGEFIELLNMDDIQKMRNSSEMKNIWDLWFDRMVLKSAIRRICSVNFHDITEAMLEMDYEAEDPSKASIPEPIQEEIRNAKTRPELDQIYKKYKSEVPDHDKFVDVLAVRAIEIKTEVPPQKQN